MYSKYYIFCMDYFIDFMRLYFLFDYKCGKLYVY